MLKNILKMFLGAVFAALMSGCAVMVAGAGVAVGENESTKLAVGVIEVGEVRTKLGVNITLVKEAKVSSEIFQKDMVTPDISPRSSDSKVNTAVTEEMKRVLNLSVNNSSLTVARLKTLYYDEISMWGFSYYYYGNVTERDTLSFMQRQGVRKIVNTHFTLEQGNNTLLEVRGLWIGGDDADEIAGARQLAREVASEVIKKLSASSAPSKDATVERGAAIALDK